MGVTGRERERQSYTFLFFVWVHARAFKHARQRPLPLFAHARSLPPARRQADGPLSPCSGPPYWWRLPCAAPGSQSPRQGPRWARAQSAW